MKRIMFIGQAMPRLKRDLHDWPSLNIWLYSIGLTNDKIKKYFFYSALVDYFPGAKKRFAPGAYRSRNKKRATKT